MLVAAPTETDVVAVARVPVLEAESVTEEVSILPHREQAPQLTVCLADTEVTLGTAVTLEAVVSGKILTSSC